MKKKVIAIKHSRRADIGEYKIYRVFPDHEVRAVGPFVFLDYVPSILHAADEPRKVVNGDGAHPHRGISTLTYVLNGEADHFDSNGHHAKVYSGGAQWMKAGNGIIHDEAMNPDPNIGDRLTHGFQFWVNLPAKNKAEQPDYRPVQAAEMPKIPLDDNAGWLKVVVGSYSNLSSPIPTFQEQFIYHIQLQPGKTFSLPTKEGLEYAMFLPASAAVVNDMPYTEQKLLLFDNREGIIEMNNPSDAPIDIIVFGGEHYSEPVVAQGPFVMNTQSEIATAYSEFFAGKYGKIEYDQQVQ
ncbi:MAG: pirin family protein [Bacteroidetes bacterium]|nr:MAG: pirin family protein [Bacteroidota bacterium]